MSGLILREEEWWAIRDVARGLQYFASTRSYTFIDRIADAFSPEIAVAALRDAIRVLRSEAERGGPVHVPRASNVERVIKLLQEHRGIGDILAALALSSWPSRREAEKPEG